MKFPQFWSRQKTPSIHSDIELGLMRRPSDASSQSSVEGHNQDEKANDFQTLVKKIRPQKNFSKKKLLALAASGLAAGGPAAFFGVALPRSKDLQGYQADLESHKQQYCDQFGHFSWLVGVSGENERFQNVPQNLTSQCLEYFGTPKTVPVPFVDSSINWHWIEAAGPFPKTRDMPDSFASEGGYYSYWAGRKNGLGITSLGIHTYHSPQKPARIDNILGDSVGAGFGVAAAGVLLTLGLQFLFLKLKKSSEAVLLGTLQKKEIFDSEIKGLQNALKELSGLDTTNLFTSEMLLSRIKAATMIRLNDKSEELPTHNFIWRETAQQVTTEALEHWVGQSLARGTLQNLHMQKDQALSRLSSFSQNSIAAQDLSAWKASATRLALLDFLLNASEIKPDAARIIRSMATLHAPALPMKSNWLLLPRPEQTTYESNLAQSIARLPNKQDERYYDLRFGNQSIFEGRAAAHADAGVKPGDSLRVTTETISDALQNAWRKDGGKMGTHLSSLLQAIETTACAEGKTRQIMEFLESKHSEVDSASSIDHLWSQVDAGNRSKTDVMTEHVRLLYAGAWRRYATDHNIETSELTEELAQRMESDPKWPVQYYSKDVLREQLESSHERITQEGTASLETLIQEQVDLGLL